MQQLFVGSLWALSTCLAVSILQKMSTSDSQLGTQSPASALLFTSYHNPAIAVQETGNLSLLLYHALIQGSFTSSRQ